jgi:hypothetical protein
MHNNYLKIIVRILFLFIQDQSLKMHHKWFFNRQDYQKLLIIRLDNIFALIL